MALTSSFVRALRAWRRAPPPVTNARLNRTTVPTYGVELGLDHLVSSIASYLADYIGSRPRWDSARFAETALEELAHLEAQVHGSERANLTELVMYVSLTRSLLEELAALPPPSADLPQSPRENARLQILSVCEMLLAGDITVLPAAAMISRLRLDFDPNQEDEDLLAFAAIDSEEDRLMVVDSEKGWHPDVRAEREAELAAAEAFHRPHAIKAATTLIDRLGKTSA